MQDTNLLRKLFFSFRERYYRVLRKTKRFISEISQQWRLARAQLAEEWELKKKLLVLAGLAVNVVVTGAVVYFVLHHPPGVVGTVLSYGLAIATICYYFEWVVEVVRRPKE